MDNILEQNESCHSFKNSATLNIGNLPRDIKPEELRTLCEKYGIVRFVDIRMEKYGRKCFALVTFTESASARRYSI